jgi:hypothetical protein
MTMAQTDDISVHCSAGCKASTDDPVRAGWQALQITGRYRCGACTRALHAVRNIQAPAAPASSQADINLARNAMLDTLDIALDPKLGKL